MKNLFLIPIILVNLIVQAQSPVKNNSCSQGGVYTTPKKVSDCAGWMHKEHIDQKSCLPNQL